MNTCARVKVATFSQSRRVSLEPLAFRYEQGYNAATLTNTADAPSMPCVIDGDGRGSHLLGTGFETCGAVASTGNGIPAEVETS